MALLKTGDKILVVKTIDSRFMRFIKSQISMWYTRALQPRKYDEFLVMDNSSYKEIDIYILF